MSFASGTPELTGALRPRLAGALALALFAACGRSQPAGPAAPAAPPPAPPPAAVPAGGAPGSPEPGVPPAAPPGEAPRSPGIPPAAPAGGARRAPAIPPRAAAPGPAREAPAAEAAEPTGRPEADVPRPEAEGGAEAGAPPRPAAPPPAHGPFRAARPDAPVEVKATPVSPTEVALEWRLPGGVAPVPGYEVRGGEEVLHTAASPARMGHLVPGHRYCFAVWALAAGDLRSEGSQPVCAETPPDVTPPGAPGGLVAEARGGEVRLRWSAAADDVGVVGYEVLRGEKVIASVSDLRATETGLRPAEHCYTVRAYDAAGNRSAPSAPACATPPDVTPPSTPAGVTASAAAEDEVALGWAPSADDVAVAGYDVRRDDAPVARVTGPAAREGGLRAATRYCYRVIAFDAAGNRSAPSEPACAVTPDLTPPGAPARLEVSAAGEGRVVLTWSQASDNVAVTGYEVWRGGGVLARLGPATAFADEGPKPSAETCYQVRALDAAGNRSQPSPSACAPTPDLTPPSAPSGVVAAAASPSRVVLSWDPSTDNVRVTGYEVRREGAAVAEVQETGAADEPVAALQEYCYTVRARDAAGNLSPPSARACARTPDPSLPLPPSGLLAAHTGLDEIELRWNASPTPGVVYVISWDGTRRALRRGTGLELGTTPLTRLKVFGQPARERHCYRVLARRGAQESSETLPICAGGAAATSR